MHTEIIHRIRLRGDPIFAIREKTTTFDLKLSLGGQKRTSLRSWISVKISEKIGLPLIVRPSYVLGGRAMEIVHEKSELKN